MRKSALAGLLVCSFIFVTSPSVSAESLELFANANNNFDDTVTRAVLDVVEKQEKPAEEKTATTKKKKPAKKRHVVAKGESLEKIAKKYNVTWKRIFYKNKTVKNPDLIEVGDKLTIPRSDEKLKKRPIPQPELAAEVSIETSSPDTVQQPNTTAARTPSVQAASNTNSTNTNTARSPRGSSAGNTYYYGYCTWYVKNRRPDLPNNLGDAMYWFDRARAQGIPTGYTPRVGAVGQRNNHVVFVEAVHGDGTITISEMNREGWNVKSSRRVAHDYFRYIY